MSVTSSFREPGNYVADHEYPDAVRKGKPLVAADMKHFDRDTLDDLEVLYPGINALMVDPDDTDALGVTLRRRLIEEAGISEDRLLDDDGEHLYYIALAYKNGIRTEADPARAAEIFRMSADNGCYESYLRLIGMYRMGDGVPKNHEHVRINQILAKAVTILRSGKRPVDPYSPGQLRLVHFWQRLRPVRRYLLFIYRHLPWNRSWIKENRNI
jgi:TPR repeat protein